MTPEELQQHLTLHGILCRVRQEEVHVASCLFCGNPKWNLELNASRGLYHCWACNAGGRLDALLSKHIGLKIHIPVSFTKQTQAPIAAPPAFASTPAYNVGPAAKYLTHRRIDPDTAKQYGLVVCTDPEHLLAGRLILPLQDFWTGAILGHVGRSFTGRHPKYLSDLPVRVIAGHKTRSKQTPCVLVEGCFDGIAIHRAGYQSAVLTSIAGGPLANRFVARLDTETPLVVMLDGAAREQAHILQATLQPLRMEQPILLATLPVDTDPADFEPSALKYVVERIVKGCH